LLRFTKVRQLSSSSGDSNPVERPDSNRDSNLAETRPAAGKPAGRIAS